MPKAYLIAHIRAHNIEKMQEFGALARPAVAKYGGTVLVTNPNPTIKEGPDSGFAVVIEFENLDAFLIKCLYQNKEDLEQTKQFLTYSKKWIKTHA